MDANRKRAIVLGGSMTGMLAARVLSDHFEHVTIIDRDHLPEVAELRDGTPQARHLHVLLAKGLQIVEDLFPGIKAEMSAKGAVTLIWGQDTTVYMKYGWMPAFDSAIQTLGISRMLLEWCVRERIRVNPRIQTLERTKVKHLVTAENNQRVIGVQIQAKGENTETSALKADLVVDATGRTTHTPEWLVNMGYGQVEESVINSFLGYATRSYKRPETFPKDKKMITIQSLPPNIPRGGVIMEIENDECVVTLAGVNKNYPPTDEDGFLEFARNLLSPAIYDIIRDAEPISNIYGYQRTENRWRHYERLTQWPDGFVVLGDAACAFNPVYGQGMTTGALEALELNKVLTEYTGKNSTGMTKSFQSRLAKVIETPWLMATGEDLRYPGTEGGKTSWQDRLVQKYIERFIDAMPLYPEIADTFVQVMNLITSPTALFQPRILLKVASSLFNRKKVIAKPSTLPTTEVKSQSPTPLT
ncbi:MAG: 2-polyprenyl-6-methoxyphenol hydroxylase-like oxidoreductase [Anaerolineaceae bacterium]|nr:2-polyprenyl-6-methoxyphenol hydroxylase-like oxidoreductase [Anaerolineaceae bacterium]